MEARPSRPAPASAGQLRWTIEDVRQFNEFTLYWLGESYEGLPLRIFRDRYEPPPELKLTGAPGQDSVTFIYGSCRPEPDEMGCAPPLSIIVGRYCLSRPESLEKGLKIGPPKTIRGEALAHHFTGERQIRLYTGDVTIDVFAADPLAAVNALEQVAPGGPRRSDPLPPPNPSGC